MLRALFLLAVVSSGSVLLAAEPRTPDYATHVVPILRAYCIGCHDAKEANGELVVETFAALAKGGDRGATLVPGKPDESLLLRVIEKKGEPFMPPEGSQGPTAAETAVIRAWIAGGAPGPKEDVSILAKLVTPKVAVKGEARRPIPAAAWSPDGNFVALARHGAVEIQSADGKTLQTLDGVTGPVNKVVFTRDGARLLAAAGETGLFGEAAVWNTAGWNDGAWSKPQILRGHRDSLYAIAATPDSKLMATGSYDQTIVLWDLATGKPIRELTGHNGSVNDLAFHPGGKLLASASSDRTIKLWDVATGERLDTFGQPEKEQYAVAFSHDGKSVIAGGVDRRLRVWQLTQMGKEGTSPLVYSRFAHDGPILAATFSDSGRLLVTSGEDRAIKLWETTTFTPQRVIKDQPDWSPALALAPDEKTLLVGRLDGSHERLSLDGASFTARTLSPVTKTVVPEVAAGTPVPTLPEVTEAEPNDAPAAATALPVPGTAHGVLQPADGAKSDADLYRIEGKAGQVWIVETNAARRNSPADTRIEILDSDGEPVLRHLLQAVRASLVEFRPIDSSQDQVRLKNWEEMELNEFLCMNGEVCKFHRMPEGPDSGFWFYTIGGKRRCYFDTSPAIHALEEPCWVVQAFAPGTKLVDNGLPVFPLYFANDDDAERKLGSDSKLTFTVPEDGAYFVKVVDVRGFGGKEYAYSLTVREPRPDFRVTVAGQGATVGKGSGQRLTFTADRIDGYDGDIRIDIAGLPAGFTAATPLVIQAGHVEARGVVNAAPDAAAPPKEAWEQVKVTATATIAGQPVTRELGHLGEIKLADKPKLLVTLEIDPEAGSATGMTGGADAPAAGEIVIRPGQRTTAILRIERNGAAGDLRFDVDNLPHGVVVDDLGLNGITLLSGQTERRIFLTARDWVPETTRLVFAICRGEGNQASLPVVFRVER